MDKQEAERLVRAIERTHVAWLQVDEIVFNEIFYHGPPTLEVPATFDTNIDGARTAAERLAEERAQADVR